ncbi:Basic form of pathogenesis-related protein 1 [Vitis vinifera]|uniref:Basic form of pathogenesis-related protein 1 n=1 Tax=Vitis vinifera TaxID=29760 RepID=A0A438C3S8_VITVI|nr:Basic form of pathogenesis-related protein 1 [Vitis vinifera]
MVGLAQTLVSQAQNTPRDFLQLHNAARREVGVGPLKWDRTLEAYAKDYAKQRSGECELVHSGGPYGENIHWGYGGGYTDVKAAMKFWLDEKQSYDYDSNCCMFRKECLHYTQIVWRNSKRLGCASAACPDEREFFTCNYDPPGNFHGECTSGFGFSYKVHRNK